MKQKCHKINTSLKTPPIKASWWCQPVWNASVKLNHFPNFNVKTPNIFSNHPTASPSFLHIPPNHQNYQQTTKNTAIHNRKQTWNPKSWRFGRCFSFSNRWFSGSILVFKAYKGLNPRLCSSLGPRRLRPWSMSSMGSGPENGGLFLHTSGDVTSWDR